MQLDGAVICEPQNRSLVEGTRATRRMDQGFVEGGLELVLAGTGRALDDGDREDLIVAAVTAHENAALEEERDRASVRSRKRRQEPGAAVHEAGEAQCSRERSLSVRAGIAGDDEPRGEAAADRSRLLREPDRIVVVSVDDFAGRGAIRPERFVEAQDRQGARYVEHDVQRRTVILEVEIGRSLRIRADQVDHRRVGRAVAVLVENGDGILQADGRTVGEVERDRLVEGGRAAGRMDEGLVERRLELELARTGRALHDGDLEDHLAIGVAADELIALQEELDRPSVRGGERRIAPDAGGDPGEGEALAAQGAVLAVGARIGAQREQAGETAGDRRGLLPQHAHRIIRIAVGVGTAIGSQRLVQRDGRSREIDARRQSDIDHRLIILEQDRPAEIDGVGGGVAVGIGDGAGDGDEVGRGEAGGLVGLVGLRMLDCALLVEGRDAGIRVERQREDDRPVSGARAADDDAVFEEQQDGQAALGIRQATIHALRGDAEGVGYRPAPVTAEARVEIGREIDARVRREIKILRTQQAPRERNAQDARDVVGPRGRLEELRLLQLGKAQRRRRKQARDIEGIADAGNLDREVPARSAFASSLGARSDRRALEGGEQRLCRNLDIADDDGRCRRDAVLDDHHAPVRQRDDDVVALDPQILQARPLGQAHDLAAARDDDDDLGSRRLLSDRRRRLGENDRSAGLDRSALRHCPVHGGDARPVSGT